MEKVIFKVWKMVDWDFSIDSDILKKDFEELNPGQELKIFDEENKHHLIIRVDEFNPDSSIRGTILNCVEDPKRVGGTYLKSWK